MHKLAQSHKPKIELGTEQAMDCRERERGWEPKQIHNSTNFKFNQALIPFLIKGRNKDYKCFVQDGGRLQIMKRTAHTINEKNKTAGLKQL